MRDIWFQLASSRNRSADPPHTISSNLYSFRSFVQIWLSQLIDESRCGNPGDVVRQSKKMKKMETHTHSSGHPRAALLLPSLLFFMYYTCELTAVTCITFAMDMCPFFLPSFWPYFFYPFGSSRLNDGAATSPVEVASKKYCWLHKRSSSKRKKKTVEFAVLSA